MAQVTVTIAGKTYRMACGDGEEQHLVGLAGRLDGMIEEMRRGFGEIGDQRLTVMAAITVLDRQAETDRRLAALEAEVQALTAERDRLAARSADLEQRLAARVLSAAARLDRISGRLAESAEN